MLYKSLKNNASGNVLRDASNDNLDSYLRRYNNSSMGIRGAYLNRSKDEDITPENAQFNNYINQIENKPEN